MEQWWLFEREMMKIIAQSLEIVPRSWRIKLQSSTICGLSGEVDEVSWR